MGGIILNRLKENFTLSYRYFNVFTSSYTSLNFARGEEVDYTSKLHISSKIWIPSLQSLTWEMKYSTLLQVNLQVTVGKLWCTYSPQTA